MNANRTAIVTGASRGLGSALAMHLAENGWNLVVDARHPAELARAAARLQAATTARVVAAPGDVADPAHAAALVAAAEGIGGVALLVNNASELGPSPLPPLAEYPLAGLERVMAVNVLAPLRLIQLALPSLRRAGGTILNISSDAAAEAYEGWGGYGASKAALEQLSRVLAAEEHVVRVLCVDPGDMNTRMHQDAFPGEDITDRPLPERRIPAIAHLLDGAPSGRYRAADHAPAGAAT